MLIVGAGGATRGVVIDFYLPEAPAPDAVVKIEFLDKKGELIRTFAPKPANYDKLDDKQKAMDPGPWLSARAGMNRVVWNLR